MGLGWEVLGGAAEADLSQVSLGPDLFLSPQLSSSLAFCSSFQLSCSVPAVLFGSLPSLQNHVALVSRFHLKSLACILM